MNHFILFMLICIVLIQNSFSNFERPDIFPQKETIVVDKGTNLTLGCVGKEPVKWSFFDTINKQLGNHTIHKHLSKTTRNTVNYEVMITVFNVTYNNSGLYFCHKENENFRASRSNNIFVYVRDENRLSFYPGMHLTKKGSRDDFTSIPCRPTAPDVNVSVQYRLSYNKVAHIDIYSNGKVNYHEFTEHKLVGTFNPTYGLFVILPFLATMNRPTTMICLFQRNNYTEQTSIYFKSLPYLRYGPYIERPILNIIEAGETMVLNCTFIIKNNEKLLWTFPNHMSRRVKVIQNPSKQLILTNKLLKSALIISNITIEDEGEYICYASDKENSKTKTRVLVIDKKMKYEVPNITYPKEKKINRSNNIEIQLNVKENITFICESSKPVTWIFPNKTKNIFPRSNAKINNIVMEHRAVIKNGKIIYRAIIAINSLCYLNIGYYYCYENNTSIYNPYTCQKLYMYVKDQTRLSIDDKIPNILPYRKNTNITIPCIPTSFEVDVYLQYKNETEVNGTTYDPHVGFTFNITFTKNLDLFCKFKLNNKYTLSTNRLLYILNFPYESLTFVDASNVPGNIAYLGEEIILYCRIIVASYVYEDPIWNITNKYRNDSITNITVSSVPIENGRVITSKLILENVQKDDKGWYDCYLSGDTNTYNHLRAQYITVVDNFDVKPVIHMSKYNQSFYGTDTILYCYVEADHNIDFNMNWVLPNTNKFFSADMEYIPTLQKIVGKSALLLKNTTFEDEGNYTCLVQQYTNQVKSAVYQLEVEKSTVPEIINTNMNGSLINLKNGEFIELFCQADGKPPPNIVWTKDGKVILQNSDTYILPYIKENDAGEYICNVSSHTGWDIRKLILDVPIEDKNPLSMILILCFIIIMVLIITLLLINQQRQQQHLRKQLIQMGILNFETGEIKSLNPKQHIVDQALLLPYDRKWDIPSDRIKIGDELGIGYFGVVFQAEIFGVFRGETIKTVAVKMVKDNTDYIRLNELISELKLMTHIGKHVNIVNLLGACTEQLTARNLMVIVEYCKYGNIQEYLIKNRENYINLVIPETGLIKYIELEYDLTSSDTITTLHLLSWAFQIARGMEYLTSRKILHADLAARNVLLSDDNIVKISDFGLSKNMKGCKIYRKKNNKGLMPIKWMAIEAIRDGVFSTQSDVWSYGIVLWELFSLGRTPYPELKTDMNFFRQICEGYRMNQPHYSTTEIYQIMLDCWETKPNNRPSFAKIIDKLKPFLGNTHKQYLKLSDTIDDANEDPDYFRAFSTLDYLTVISNNCHADINSAEENIPMTSI